jgi:hypothetical protein
MKGNKSTGKGVQGNTQENQDSLKKRKKKKSEKGGKSIGAVMSSYLPRSRNQSAQSTPKLKDHRDMHNRAGQLFSDFIHETTRQWRI